MRAEVGVNMWKEEGRDIAAEARGAVQVERVLLFRSVL